MSGYSQAYQSQSRKVYYRPHRRRFSSGNIVAMAVIIPACGVLVGAMIVTARRNDSKPATPQVQKSEAIQPAALPTQDSKLPSIGEICTVQPIPGLEIGHVFDSKESYKDYAAADGAGANGVKLRMLRDGKVMPVDAGTRLSVKAVSAWNSALDVLILDGPYAGKTGFIKLFEIKGHSQNR